MSRETRCYVPGCTNTSGSNPEVTFHKPRDSDTKRKWEAVVASRHPDVRGEIHVSRVCSSHFAEDAYMETDVLQIRLGVPKRKRLKADAVPTIFPEPTRPRSAEVQSTSFTEASASDVERMESASDAGECFSLQQSMSSAGPENALVLDGLPLEPFVPYQIVSQYGFHYTLVPHKPESVAERVQDKETQTAIPTSTLGTQTGFHMQSRESQTGMSLPPSSSLLLTSSELATWCPEDSNIESVEVSAGQASMQHIGAPAFEELMPTDMLYMPLSPVHCSTPAREELDTTLGSTCQPDPKDVTVHSSELTEGSETEDDEYEKEHEGHHSKSHVHRTLNPEERLFLVAESSLRELLSQCPCGSSDAETDISTRGRWLRAATACSCGKLRTWSSQPWVEDRPLGNILLCSAILFSGVNITKAFRMFAMMKVPTLTLSQYFRTQKQHLFPAVNDVFLSRQAELLDWLRPVPLTLAGDGRCDSPGHTALYGTYTLLETVANRIIHFELVKSTEVSSSNAMEVHGLKNCLAYLEAHDMVVDTIVTDRHTAIKSVLRELCPHIKHRFDVWHVAKGIKKKLVSLSRSTKHHVVKFWIESLIRHIYWCPKYSGESGDLCLAKWVSAVNHIVDVHEHDNPLYPVCYHGPVSEPREWLKEDSETYAKVKDILTAPALLRDVPMLSTKQQTYGLESYHSVLNHFVPKSYSFSDEGMVARTQLAILHYNENADRVQVEREGSKQFRLKPSKLKKTWVAVPLKENATYDYAATLIAEVLTRIQEHQMQSAAAETRPARSATYGEKPTLRQAVEQHQTRFQKGK